MTISATFKPSPTLNADLAKMSGTLLLTMAQLCETEAKRRVPVRTGNLRRSITSSLAVEKGLPVGIVAATAHYAAFVELGTRYQNPQPFLRPALLAVVRL